ncbi:uncharacterized protein LOC554327 isoform X3 [Mus musculus]|uniref:uncharacterized protein LOC554327 isoform X3 n=1 Tax=Mus musculus TaxID=10090 RepID=UPI00167A825F|nr:uncharacterized protein LOC554327 isoform X3 [Mus musculus]
MELHSCGCGGGGGGRDRRGGGGGGERVGSQRAPCLCAPSVSGRGLAGWSRSTCAPCLDPRAQPGRNRKSSVLVSQHERLKLKPSQRCEMEQEQWLNVELFKTWRMGCWCTTIIPNTPVQKMGEETTQPMTSGKNELQDHLIFISEKALHKRNRIVWSKGYSTAEQKDLVMQKKNKQ